jgi:hypothetical protein
VRAPLISFFRLYLVFSLLVGICLILISADIRSSHGSEYLVDVIRDLGIGLVVSVFVVVFIEWRAGLTLRSEIAADVLAAVYRRTIPDIIFNQDSLRSERKRRRPEPGHTRFSCCDWTHVRRAEAPSRLRTNFAGGTNLDDGVRDDE